MASANSVFWGFCAYVKRNPFKTFGGMTQTDFENMRDLYIAANTDLSTTATYTTTYFPGAIAAADTAVAANQATYPEKHKGS